MPDVGGSSGLTLRQVNSAWLAPSVFHEQAVFNQQSLIRADPSDINGTAFPGPDPLGRTMNPTLEEDPIMRKKSKKKANVEMLLVGSKVKAAIRENGMNVAGDAAEALNNVVHWYIAQAASRAAANGRKTVRGHDFLSM